MEQEGIKELLKTGEKTNVEFKEYLSSDIHLKKQRRESLASQLKYRLMEGNGEAVYVIGVKDNGEICGVSNPRFNETIDVLRSVAKETNAHITNINKYPVKTGLAGKITLETIHPILEHEHVLIGTAGHVDHGKSTLIGTLITGELDDGAGRTRLYLDVLPHEIERGLSAELSFAVYGFDDEGQPIRLKNPLDKSEKARVVETAQKLISFVDTVGHEPWLRTTIRGIVGQRLDYGLLTVATDDGVTHVTKEHLAVLFAMKIPTIITITKTDRAPERVEDVEEEIVNVLKGVGKIPIKIRTTKDMDTITHTIRDGVVVPIIRTSPVSGEGIGLLNQLLLRLPSRKTTEDVDKPFLLYIDKIYSIVGVGTVVSGTIKQGILTEGQKLLLGPDSQGRFREVRATSIEMHHFKVRKAIAGDIIGVAIKGVKPDDVRRGMILASPELQLKPIREFQAEIMILNHPTRIGEGYEPVCHVETVAEAVAVQPLDKEYLAAGDVGKVRMRFKYGPHILFNGQKIVFREGKTKGIGYITRVIQ